MTHHCPDHLRAALRDALYAEAADLLDQARRNDENGHKAQARWARDKAWGLMRARALVGAL